MYRKLLPRYRTSDIQEKSYHILMDKNGLEEDINYYEGLKKKKLHLIFIFDKDEIKSVFKATNSNQIFNTLSLILILVLCIWYIIHRLAIKPLERLRQYAYYQNEIPKSFILKELETIRYSMVETFRRLDIEKKELYDLARRDSLSGLANRNALLEHLQKLIDKSKRKNEEFAVLFLDLDHFKSVNDSLGHNVGDALLQKVATIIEKVLRSNDFVARVGGDEFVIVLQEYNSMRELTNIIDRIQSTLAKTRIIQSHPIETSSSIGIALYPKDGDSIVSLMKNSDISMYEAKKNGRSQYHFFTKTLNDRIQDRITLEKEMKLALLNDEYELYYQPKVNIETGKIEGAEALIRWNSPIKGMISPNEFIPLAEENDFIIELGKWVFQTALKQQVKFYEAGIKIKISINLSSKQLLEPNFMEFFERTMQESKAIVELIDIEITEYMFYENSDKNIEILSSLHKYGVSISLDDFGTGYSSLSYLKDFPIDNLKIDKAFIDDIDKERGRVFVDTIVKMGQTLKMRVIAEGVEDREQLEYLKSIGCDEYQGYFMSKPVNVDAFRELYFKESK
jgi:diguanylate cyclase (GGDEF)-like protein